LATEAWSMACATVWSHMASKGASFMSML
jgi:hypothetical protein